MGRWDEDLGWTAYQAYHGEMLKGTRRDWGPNELRDMRHDRISLETMLH